MIGEPGPVIERAVGKPLVTVFVPTAPNPTSGYTVMVPQAELRELDISVDDALKFVVSLGVVTPTVARSVRPATLTSAPPA